MRKRRFLAILLAALLMFGAVSAQALADNAWDYTAKVTYADGRNKGFIDYTEAIDAANKAEQDVTITLLKDLTLSAPLEINNSNGVDITLDLNGKTMNGGTVTYNLIAIKGANVTITGNGTVNATNLKYNAVYVDNGGSCTIENGTFKANESTDDILYASPGTDSKIVVTGGNFSQEPRGYLAYNCTITLNDDGTYTVSALTDDDDESVASVTVGGETTYYPGLQSAFLDVLDDERPATITLLKDEALGDPLEITGYGARTLDLNGKTVSAGDWFGTDILGTEKYLINIEGGQGYTITGNGTVNAGDLAIAVNVNDQAECTIENGTFKADKTAVRADTSNSYGTVLIKGGAFWATGDGTETLMANSTPSRAGIIRVVGGTFFEYNPALPEYSFMATGCTSARTTDNDGNAWFTVSLNGNKFLLENTNTVYATFNEALTAANDANGAVFIDMLGNSVTVHDDGAFNQTGFNDSLRIDKDVTIKNGKFALDEVKCSQNAVFEAVDKSSVTFKNVKFTGENLEDVGFAVLYACNDSDFNLYNCDFVLADFNKNIEDEDEASMGGLLKGNSTANFFQIYDCTFKLDDPISVIKLANVDMAYTTIEATNTNGAASKGVLTNHAFRAVEGDIKDSSIKLSGFETGIKNNDREQLTLTSTELTITDSIDWDILLENSANIGWDEDSKVVVGKVKVEFNYNDPATTADSHEINPDAPVATPATPTLLIDTNGGQLDISELGLEDGITTIDGDVVLGTPTKTGYTFAGWYSDAELENALTDSTIPYDAEMTAYAKWTKNSTGGGGGGGSHKTYYTVTFDSNGGSKVANQSVAKNSTASEPTAPTREGYTFAGWYTDSKLTDEFDFATRITKTTKLYAKWDEKSGTGTGTETKPGAGSTNSYCIILTLDEYEAIVYGETRLNDVTPLAVNNRVMMPTRFVAENLFCTVHWDKATGIITISGTNFVSGASMEIILTINSNTATVNGKTVTLDSTTFVQNNRIYTPLRFIAETLGATVDWNSSTEKITVTLPATTISDELIATLK